MLKFRLAAAMGLLALVTISCRSLRPYEKEHLLKPSMDDARVGLLEPVFAKSSVSRLEKLADGSASGGGGSSCPTCGI